MINQLSIRQALLTREGADAFTRGYLRGYKNGFLTGMRSVIVTAGTKRFGEPAPEFTTALDEVTSVRELETLLDRILDVESWSELLA